MNYRSPRLLKAHERMLVELLSARAGSNFKVSEEMKVYEINPEMGSIRAYQLRDGERVKAHAQCTYLDKDGTTVIVALLQSSSLAFGELDFWRVDDQPIMEYPNSPNQLEHFQIF